MNARAIKKNFYSGATQEIAMPPLDEAPPIASVGPDIMPNQQQAQPSQQAFNVPDEVSSDIMQSMNPESEQEEQDEQVEAVVEQPVVQRVAKTQQENFKSIREAKEKAERERDILLQELARQQQSQPQQRQAPKIEEPDSELDLLLDDEALVEGKHAKKMITAMKKMREEMRSYRNQSDQFSVETRIKNNFPDFDKVVSTDNVEMLNEMYPEIAQSLKDTGDMYTKAAAAYKVIKNMGIYNEQKEDFMAKKQIVAKNAAKPKPLASVSPQQGDSPLSKANAFANGLTKELQDQLRKEMYAARKGH